MIQDAPSKQRTKQQAKKDRVAARERFRKAHLAEKAFARRLKNVAREVGKIIKRYAPQGQVTSMPGLSHALKKYSDLLGPWAEATARSLVSEVDNRDARAWHELGSTMGRSLKMEIRAAPTGLAMRKIMNEQVKLIKSLPVQAGERVHHLTLQAMGSSTRAAHVAKEILRSGRVTESRAKLIAQTETTRTATAMVESRAKFIGSKGYIWRTAEDSDVRHDHKKLEGVFVPWDRPPVAGPNGQRYHAGAGPNCRCYPEPVIPDDLT